MSENPGWIRAEFKRAKQRGAQLPEYAKPVVCSTRTVTRLEHLLASRLAESGNDR